MLGRALNAVIRKNGSFVRRERKPLLECRDRRNLPSADGKLCQFARPAQVTLPASERQLVNDTVHEAMVYVEIRAPIIHGRVVVVQVSIESVGGADAGSSGFVIQALRPSVYGQKGKVSTMMIHGDIPRVVIGIPLPEAV